MPEYDHWEKQGLCTQIDPELFFPDVGKPSKYAKSICNDCSVCAKCLIVALDNPSLVGVWGGTTQRERANMRSLARK